MGALLICWLLFPLLLLLVTLGLGLLLERAVGLKLPGSLHVPCGFACLVVLAQLTTMFGVTARLTPVFVVVLTVVGLWLGRTRLSWPTGSQFGVALVAFAAFAVYAAPVVLSGSATFAGYALNGDTAVHFSVISYLMEHGRDFDTGTPLSSYSFVVKGYIDGSGYPSGGQLALGAVWHLSGQDIAWIFQPFMAFLGFVLFWSLYGLCRPFVKQRSHCAAVSFFAATATLVVGFALQGGIKEMTALALIPLLFGLLRQIGAGARSISGPLVLAVVVSALLAALGIVALAWALPVMVVALGILLQRNRQQLPTVLGAGVIFSLALLVLSLPTVMNLADYLNVSQKVLTSQVEKGTLLSSLHHVQMFGVWPVGDFRFEPSAYLLRTYLLIGGMVVLAVWGAVYLVRRRQGVLGLFVVVSFAVWAFLTYKGSPWADAKALMIVSPAAVLLTGFGLLSLIDSGRRFEAYLIAVPVGLGILISNAFAYHDVTLAPKQRLLELGKVGTLAKGTGDTLYTEFEEFGKYFLRDSVPEGLSDSWRDKQTLLRGGYPVRYGYSQDLDEVPVSFILKFPNIVMRRSPVRTRPPAGYRMTFRGRYYELWQRRNRAERVVAHLPLGDPTKVQGGSLPAKCRDVAKLARVAQRRAGWLAYVETAPSTVGVPAGLDNIPSSWGVYPWLGNEDSSPLALETIGAGTLQGSFEVDLAGRYLLWIGGSFGRSIAVDVDGKPVALVKYQLSGKGQYLPVATLTLQRGTHTIRFGRGSGRNLHPGSGGRNRTLGPVVFARLGEGYRDRVQYLSAGRYRQLCDKQLDWVEVVTAAG